MPPMACSLSGLGTHFAAAPYLRTYSPGLISRIIKLLASSRGLHIHDEMMRLSLRCLVAHFALRARTTRRLIISLLFEDQ